MARILSPEEKSTNSTIGDIKELLGEIVVSPVVKEVSKAFDGTKENIDSQEQEIRNTTSGIRTAISTLEFKFSNMPGDINQIKDIVVGIPSSFDDSTAEISKKMKTNTDELTKAAESSIKSLGTDIARNLDAKSSEFSKSTDSAIKSLRADIVKNLVSTKSGIVSEINEIDKSVSSSANKVIAAQEKSADEILDYLNTSDEKLSKLLESAAQIQTILSQVNAIEENNLAVSAQLQSVLKNNDEIISECAELKSAQIQTGQFISSLIKSNQSQNEIIARQGELIQKSLDVINQLDQKLNESNGSNFRSNIELQAVKRRLWQKR